MRCRRELRTVEDWLAMNPSSVAPPGHRVYDWSDGIKRLKTYKLYWVVRCKASHARDREPFLSPHWNYFNDVRAVNETGRPDFVIEATSVQQACSIAYALIGDERA